VSVLLVVAAGVAAVFVLMASDDLGERAKLAWVALTIPLTAVAAFSSGFSWLVLGRFLRLQERRDDQLRRVIELLEARRS
jgi:hypothetical protein